MSAKQGINLSELPVGPQPISTGTAELKAIDGGLLLLVNGVESSCYDLSDPAYLDFEYLQQMSVVAEACFPLPQPLNALHLGGGACSLARAWAAKRPGGRGRVVELDEKLAEFVRTWFDLPRSPELSIRVGDAAEVAATFRDETFDVVVRDVFAGAHTPEHIWNTEATAHYARILKPGGLFLANVEAAPGSISVAQEWQVIREHFPEVIAIAAPTVARGDRRGNVVVAASDKPLPVSQIEVDLRRLPLPVSLVGAKIKRRWEQWRG
ncbi:hypothetical protein BSR29_03710 [Boudabousia liubingyangii]|uniref:Methyltransferase type 11 domain-containing protein n=1 Tax=Boudabousia liubingyangii TaxID=1921764 RepID=A0A1Q5PN24_9ACTO|nr:fused MFS/spermidine synthase [Boudabousia liubingyangii]OKL48958.1 hypothetical protein BSR29_03710 [Boudabousia liubingyangii]